MDFLSAPSNFLAQWFRNFESKDLGLRFPSLEFSRTTVAIIVVIIMIALRIIVVMIVTKLL